MKKNNRKVKFVSVLNWVILFSLPVILLTVNIRTNTITSSNDTKTLATSLFTKVIENKEEVPLKTEEVKNVKAVVKEEPTKKIVATKVKTEEDYEAARKKMEESVPTPPPVVEKKYSLGLKFTGNMSGYGPWFNEEKNKWELEVTSKGHNLRTQGIYTNDSTYGKVRIVAADTTTDENRYYILPTYSIIKCTLTDGTTFNVIVLDRGDKNIGRGKKFEFDLAYESEDQATTLKNVSFEILRMGP